jgi:IS30 family transposase
MHSPDPLRPFGTQWRPRWHVHGEQLRGKISGAISIRERPAEAEDRAVPGHWEGDLLCGLHRSQIITLVERHSAFLDPVQQEWWE